MSRSDVEFGLGLIGIGRPWGYRHAVVPGERDARTLLTRTFEIGVRYFDTAPSYGSSEQRLGAFLGSLGTTDRAGLRIATKFGEHWDFARAEPFVDHSYDALRRSLDQSLRLLGRIDVLQLHKTTPEALRSADLARAWEYARSLGIGELGASVSDLVSATIALESGCDVMQLPYNTGHRLFEATIAATAAKGIRLAVNRPFGMGRLVYEEQGFSRIEAFAFILRRNFQGVILSGTKSPAHLEENWEAFRKAKS
jgi:aryl-alcohol dehydrogenase-like predicted oxidoreductase